MRNLKRALSLAVASVMLLGMMVVGTGASYADVTSEHNQEAIDVLHTVGVMVGDETGDFNPNDNVTRNEMAVIMSNLMDYRVASYAGTAPFTDVPTWAEPYVAACYTHGIVYGTTATYYNGAATVTAAEAALMLMKALGYFQYQSDFEDDWQLATIRQAAKIDLYDGIKAGVTEPMTRNEVAQMVLNTLEATMVEADDSTINVTAGGATVQAGKISYDEIFKSGKKYIAIGDTNAVQLGEDLYDGDLKKFADVRDIFGRPGTKWEYKLDSIGTFNDEPLATYTAKASKGVLYTLLGKDRVKELEGDTELSVYNDGRDTTADKSNYFQSNSSTAAGVDGNGISGKGVLTEVYMDDDGNVTIVYINTYLMKATADYNEKKESLNVEVITPERSINVNSLSAEDFDVADYEDEDYILFTASYDGSDYSIEEIASAEVVSGEVNAYSVENYVTLDGTKYEYSVGIETVSKTDTYVVADNASVVLDAYGYVLYIDDASISAGNYVYIAKTVKASGMSSKVLADAFFTDGTNEEINVKKMTEGNDELVTEWIDGQGDFAGWYSYTKNSSGKYTLKQASTYEGISTAKITAGKVNFTGVSGGYNGNANTMFIVNDDGDVAIYTGIANIPDISGTMTVGAMREKDDADKTVSLVYVDATKATISNTEESILYVLKLDSTYVDKADGESIYRLLVILDGEEITIETKDPIMAAGIGNMYTDFSIDSDGYYEEATDFTTKGDNVTKALSGKISYSAGTLTIAGDAYTTNSDTKVVLIMRPDGTGSNLLKKDIMTDEGAKYEVEFPNARSLASFFNGYTAIGDMYAVMDDIGDSDLIATLYVVVTGVTKLP